MELFLLRHADADTAAPTDDERPLSEKGFQQAKRVARYCEQYGFYPSVILSSPLPRALQTATEVAERLGLKVTVMNWLASGAPADNTLLQLRSFQEKPRVMIVGHEPDFSQLCGLLLGVDPEKIHLRKASLTQLHVLAMQPGGARLEFSIPVKLM